MKRISVKDRDAFQELRFQVDNLGRDGNCINLKHPDALMVLQSFSTSSCRHPCMRNIFLEFQSALFYFQPPTVVAGYNEMYNILLTMNTYR